MKKEKTVNLGKEVYKELRTQSWDTLWTKEVPLFDSGTKDYRVARVGLIRALGVVALERGTSEQKNRTRQWLMGLLQDSEERIRRYAMAALPKIGDSSESEQALLALLNNETGQREINHLSRALDKIGGVETLEKLEDLRERTEMPKKMEQRIMAKIARSNQPAKVLLDAHISNALQLRIHLRTRRGLEGFVSDELLAHPTLKNQFKILKVDAGCVALSALSPFSFNDLYKLRTFGSVNLVLGIVSKSEKNDVEALVGIISSALTRQLCRELTEGQPRYRLEFMRQKVSRNKVQAVINQVFLLCPELLNDSSQSPWSIEIYPEKIGSSVELRPRILPDPRFLYRVDDVPAASHPPLAAAMALLAGQEKNEVVWDPFCGSGLELIERSLLGNFEVLIGTDLDAKAIEISRLNLLASGQKSGYFSLHCCDFLDHRKIARLAPGSVSLIITNPPMGRRVHIADMQGLFNDLFRTAAITLRKGGRLVFVNPLKTNSPDALLQLVHRQVVDMGGFDCRLEKWVKS